MTHTHRLIILDRDGVINHESEAYIKSPQEWHPIPGSLEAIARLHQAGYLITVATNQSGVGRGLYDLAMLDAIHNTMHQAVKQAGGQIDAIFYCPHLPTDDCDCRKPKPGLLYQIAAHFNVSLQNVPFIGDTWRDVLAARTVEAKPLLVKTGFGEKTIEKYKAELGDVLIGDDLAQVVTWILK